MKTRHLWQPSFTFVTQHASFFPQNTLFSSKENLTLRSEPDLSTAAVLTVKTSEEISELAKVLQAKWEHLLPVSSALESELFRWKGYCQQKALGDVSVTGLLSSHADNLFFPNIRELLKILAVLPIGSTEAERSFSCVRRIHTWLRSRMTTDRLSDLAVIAMHCHSIHIDRDKVYNKYMAIHPRRMMSASLLHD